MRFFPSARGWGSFLATNLKQVQVRPMAETWPGLRVGVPELRAFAVPDRLILVTRCRYEMHRRSDGVARLPVAHPMPARCTADVSIKRVPPLVMNIDLPTIR